MNSPLKKVALAIVFMLPAVYVSAQSSAIGETSLPQTAPVYAVQTENTLAYLAPEPEVTTTKTSAITVSGEEPAAAKSMSEELSMWVENKLAVVNSVKGLKRLK